MEVRVLATSETLRNTRLPEVGAPAQDCFLCVELAMGKRSSLDSTISNLRGDVHK